MLFRGQFTSLFSVNFTTMPVAVLSGAGPSTVVSSRVFSGFGKTRQRSLPTLGWSFISDEFGWRNRNLAAYSVSIH